MGKLIDTDVSIESDTEDTWLGVLLSPLEERVLDFRLSGVIPAFREEEKEEGNIPDGERWIEYFAKAGVCLANEASNFLRGVPFKSDGSIMRLQLVAGDCSLDDKYRTTNFFRNMAWRLWLKDDCGPQFACLLVDLLRPEDFLTLFRSLNPGANPKESWNIGIVVLGPTFKPTGKSHQLLKVGINSGRKFITTVPAEQPHPPDTFFAARVP